MDKQLHIVKKFLKHCYSDGACEWDLKSQEGCETILHEHRIVEKTDGVEQSMRHVDLPICNRKKDCSENTFWPSGIK